MPPVGFEPKISAGERPQTYALDRAATETGMFCISLYLIIVQLLTHCASIRKVAISIPDVVTVTFH